jgi:uncharacterized surface protein with fasciclin (FAS1) repeats
MFYNALFSQDYLNPALYIEDISMKKIILLLIITLLAGCSQQATLPRDRDLLHCLQADRRITAFVELLEQTDMVHHLSYSSQKPYTVFAPGNDAMFSTLSRAEYHELTQNQKKREAFVKNHIRLGSWTVQQVETERSFQSLHNGQIFVHPTRGLSTDAAHPVPYRVQDTLCVNGVIHIMGGILLPRSL